MSCNSGQRKVFADELVAAVTEVARKHGLADIEVQRDMDPVVVAARGCLRKEGEAEAIQLLVQVSADLQAADRATLVGAQTASDSFGEVFRAFDLSEVVARETAAAGSEPDRPDPCKDQTPPIG